MNYKLLGKIFATGIMSFCGVVSETAMNVTFPTLMTEFGIGTETVQWVTTGYLLVLSLVITLSSYLKRNFTSRQLFLTAMGCFITATALCFWSPQFWVLVAGRMLQGVGSGIALPLMFNIILAEAPKEKLGAFMGVGSLITAMAPAVGPVLGGFIVDHWGWNYIFVVLLCLLLPSLVLGAWLIRDTAAGVGGADGTVAAEVGGTTGGSHFHLVDYLLIVVGYSAFILATVSASRAGWLSPVVLGLLVAAVGSILVFARKSKSEASPLLRFEVLGHSSFVLGLGSILIAQFATLAVGYVIPNYSQLVNHTSAFLAGGLLVPGCIVGAVLAIVAGIIYDKLGPVRPILTGNALLLTAMILFSLFGLRLTTPMFFGFYVVYTLGQGLCIGNTMTYSLSRLPKDLSADGNALINSLQQLAGAAGTAVAATIVSAGQASVAANVADAAAGVGGAAKGIVAAGGGATGGATIATGTAIGSSHVFILLAVLLAVALIAAVGMFRKRC